MSAVQRQMLLDSFNSEMDRYWTRFNIFSAVQAGALVGVVNSINLLVLNKGLFRFCFVFVIVISVTGALNTLRGHDIQQAIMHVLMDTEKGLPDDQKFRSKVMRQLRFRDFIGNHICAAFSIFCCLAWLCAWLWLEHTGYAIHLPKSPAG